MGHRNMGHTGIWKGIWDKRNMGQPPFTHIYHDPIYLTIYCKRARHNAINGSRTDALETDRFFNHNMIPGY